MWCNYPPSPPQQCSCLYSRPLDHRRNLARYYGCLGVLKRKWTKSQRKECWTNAFCLFEYREVDVESDCCYWFLPNANWDISDSRLEPITDGLCGFFILLSHMSLTSWLILITEVPPNEVQSWVCSETDGHSKLAVDSKTWDMSILKESKCLNLADEPSDPNHYLSLATIGLPIWCCNFGTGSTISIWKIILSDVSCRETATAGNPLGSIGLLLQWREGNQLTFGDYLNPSKNIEERHETELLPPFALPQLIFSLQQTSARLRAEAIRTARDKLHEYWSGPCRVAAIYLDVHQDFND